MDSTAQGLQCKRIFIHQYERRKSSNLFNPAAIRANLTYREKVTDARNNTILAPSLDQPPHSSHSPQRPTDDNHASSKILTKLKERLSIEQLNTQTSKPK